MEIRRAAEWDIPGILQYDCHIQPDRVNSCVRNGLMDVLCEGERILGILRYNLFWQSVPFLDLLYIDKACRGEGWGRRMMQKWETSMKQMGYPYVMLTTQADESARDFYEKLGYRRIGAFLPPEQDAEELMYLKEFAK